ncbi:MAG: type II secretion system F family protein [Candidatus Omnitrophota bacterium]|nr:type II secretion system F family protein [Candidatus Omnitrophota bacterium]
MASFQYTARDKSGNSVTGIVDSNSEAGAIEVLHDKELVVVSIKEARKKVPGAGYNSKAVKSDDLVIFVRQLATMIDAGIPLVHSLGILAEQIESPNLKKIVAAVRRDIEEGMSFGDALAKHQSVFSELFINMVRAGEASGMLDEVLERLAAYLEKSATLARKIRSSLVYPAVVVTMAILITGVLLLKVVPTFKGIFDSLGGSLPLPTKILIFVSNLLRQYLLFIIGLLIISGFLFKKYISTPTGRYQFDQQKLRVPVLGQLFRKLAVAKFSRTLSTLVKSGVAVLSALDIVAKTSGNRVVEEAVLNCAKGVREGEPIAKPLSRGGIFPPMVCRMVSVGEQTGQLEKMLSKIADFYDEQVDAAATGLTSMIEPLIIAFLGVVIGGIVLSLFLPIFKITELISK